MLSTGLIQVLTESLGELYSGFTVDKYGPLYHRNSRLLPKAWAKSVVGVVILIGIVEFVLGLIGLIR